MWPNRAAAALLAALLLGGAPVAGAIGVAPAAAEPAAASLECREDVAIFTRPAQPPLSFEVEIADTEAARARGLMYRRELPAGQGMLFIYDTPRPVSFWMRNTLIPLDLIFMDARGEIRHIHRNAIPLDETPIPGAAPGDPDRDRLMILEIAGGEAARLGLAPGQAMAHPRLDQRIARQPCR